MNDAPTQRVYYLTGFVRIEAASDEEADRKFNEAGLGIDVEIADGVYLDFQGGWDEIQESTDPPCTCPPELAAGGGFSSRCALHGRGTSALAEDHDPIKPVPAAVREAWEPKGSGYTREQFEQDRKGRS